jgi:hypothetical protein
MMVFILVSYFFYTCFFLSNFSCFFGQRQGIAMDFMEGVGTALHLGIVWHRNNGFSISSLRAWV